MKHNKHFKKIKVLSGSSILIAAIIFCLATPLTIHAEDKGCCEIKNIPDNGQSIFDSLTKAECEKYNGASKQGIFNEGQKVAADKKSCEATEDEGGVFTPSKPTPPVLSVSIPGFGKFSDINCSEPGTPCKIPWLAEYIKGLFNYSLVIIGVLAVIVIMIGGIMWQTAGGNRDRIGEASRYIKGGILGIVLAASSYTLLFILSPDLTILKSLNINYLDRIDVYELSVEEQKVTLGTTSEGEVPTNQGSSHGVPWFLQCSDIGRKQTYGNCSGATVCKTGCGLISTQMVLAKFGKTPSLSEWEKTAVDNGARICGNGSVASGLIKAAEKYGLKGQQLNGTESIKKKLDEGVPVIISVRGPCKFTQNGHFIVLTGWRDKDKLIADVNDPANGRDKEERTWISLKDYSGCSLNQQFYLYQ